MSTILKLRRRQTAVADAADNVVLVGYVLRCCRCAETWTARAGIAGDALEPQDTHCPRCTDKHPHRT